MKNDRLINDFLYYAQEVLDNESVQSMSNFRQHNNTDCLQHSLNVAFQCYKWYCKYDLNINIDNTIRGALLHDFFLYDWHVKNGHHGLHAFSHPKIALKNANQIFKLSAMEKDIIAKHMFPLTISLPAYKESWLVILADKYIASLELLKIKKLLINISY